MILATIACCTQVLAESFQIRISPRDEFKVSVPPQWTLKQKKYNENQDAEFSVLPKNQSFVLKMFFLRVNDQLDSKKKVRDRLVFDGQEFLTGSLEDHVGIKEMKLKTGFGFYATFTDSETANKPDPGPADYVCMTRGYIRLSDDSLLGFWMLTHRTDDEVFQQLAKYLASFIK